MNQGISSANWLGTDNMGRDLLSRLSLALAKTVLPMMSWIMLAFVLGLLVLLWNCGQTSRLAATMRVWARACGHTLVSIPLMIAIFFLMVLLPDYSAKTVIKMTLFLTTFFKTQSTCYLCFERDQHLAYWDSHLSLGGTIRQRVLRYGILGHWLTPLMQYLAAWPHLGILLAASLSYLGIGIAEPQASLGNMLAMHFHQFVKGHTHIILVISVAIALVMAAASSLLSFFPTSGRQADASDQMPVELR